MSKFTRVSAVLAAVAAVSSPGGVAFGQAQSQPTASRPAGAPPRQPGGREQPRPGPVALPILPALPKADDRDFYAETNVPHGKVEQVTYTNFAGQEKRMHVYLPPGYDTDTSTSYPVLYINHGGGENDSHWSSNASNGGHTRDILDNLIAAKKAKPMIVAMPNTSGLASNTPPPKDADDACSQEYLKDIIPLIEKKYRAKASRENRALAGLSMGGFVVLDTGLSHLDTFGELYVYSSGYFPDQVTAFEERFKDVLSGPKTNRELLRVPIYIGLGETDIALKNGQATWAVINRYGVRNFFVLSSGGHEWMNWRRYLYQTAQVMFPSDQK